MDFRHKFLPIIYTKNMNEIFIEKVHKKSKISITILPIFFIIFFAILGFNFWSKQPLNFAQNSAFTNAQNLVKYTGEIAHVFTHCLIANTDIAFAKNNEMRKHYDTDCLTTKEFKNILSELNKNNYVLIKPSSIFEVKNGIATKKTLYLPQGKKPLIMSFDDVNYDRKKMGLGMVDKIVLDSSKNIATCTGKSVPEYNAEFVTILEDFITRHPDFSFNGARGLICLTGYDGILGYRTNRDSANRDIEIASVKPVIAKLKSLGWEFASHSYGHYHMKKISNEKFKNDIAEWKNEVEPLVGKTQIYVYPYGEREIINENNLSPKHKALEDAGFRLFCGVGVKNYFSYLPNPLHKKILFMDRTPLDGYTLRNNYMSLRHLFDIKKVYDNSRDIKLDEFCI